MLIRPNSLFNEVSKIRKLKSSDLPKAGRIADLNNHYSVMPKNTTLLTGYPSSGKSYLLLNLQMALSRIHGHKHVIFSPEMGAPEWITLKLINIYAGKWAGGMNDMQVSQCMNWLQEHFVILSCDNTPMLKDIEEGIKEAKSLLGDIGTFSIDNLNDMKHVINTPTYDMYYEPWMLEFNNIADRHNTHGFLTAHPLTGGGIDTSVPPKPDRIKGGGAFWNKGYNILSWARDGEHGTLAFYKIKPEIVGKFGEINMHCDFNRYTYFKQDNFERRQYLFEQEFHPETAQKNGSSFNGQHPDLRIQPTKEEDLPF